MWGSWWQSGDSVTEFLPSLFYAYAGGLDTEWTVDRAGDENLA